MIDLIFEYFKVTSIECEKGCITKYFYQKISECQSLRNVQIRNETDFHDDLLDAVELNNNVKQWVLAFHCKNKDDQLIGRLNQIITQKDAHSVCAFRVYYDGPIDDSFNFDDSCDYRVSEPEVTKLFKISPILD